MTFYKFSVGVVLALAMIAVLFMSAVVFSSRDFQFGVAQVAPATNGLVNFERLEEAQQQIQRIESETSAPRGELLEVQSRIDTIDAASLAAQTRLNEVRAEIVLDIAQIERNAEVAPAQSAAADTSAQALSTRINALAARPNLSPTDQQTVVALNSQAAQLAQDEATVSERDAERETLAARQRALSGQVAESNARIFALQQSVVPNYEHFGRISNEAAALQGLSRLGVSADLAQGHPALLSTFLVLLMGALGSLLYLFPAYLNRAVPVTMAEIVVRLIFGMCAAFALYMLANAAIAGFSMTSSVQQATTSSALNPFAVSLIGIVAGVLSEDIAQWIQERGRGIFQQGGASATRPPPPPVTNEPSATGGLVNNDALNG
jgi:hypothetical protein